MDLKEKIEKLLLNLKKLGFDRRIIEQDLGYSANYIDRTFSKGGTIKFLNALEKYYQDKTKSEKGDALYNTNEERIIALEIQIQVLLHTIAQLNSKLNNEPIATSYLDLQRLLDKEIKKHMDEA